MSCDCTFDEYGKLGDQLDDLSSDELAELVDSTAELVRLLEEGDR